MKIELTEAAASELRDVVAETLSDLSMEISHTDSAAYREVLKQRRTYLEEVRHQLEVREEGAQAYV